MPNKPDGPNVYLNEEEEAALARAEAKREAEAKKRPSPRPVAKGEVKKKPGRKS